MRLSGASSQTENLCVHPNECDDKRMQENHIEDQVDLLLQCGSYSRAALISKLWHGCAVSLQIRIHKVIQ